MAEISTPSILSPVTNGNGVVQQPKPSGFEALGQGDFLRLLVTQLEQQDPFEPVDNKDMLAQMAQFSSLAGTTQSNDTLQQILGKLDALIAVQTTAVQTAQQPSNQE